MPKSNEKKTGTVRSMSSPIRYLPCLAEPGMFKDELLVYVSGFDPSDNGKAVKAQLLVDQQEVEGLQGIPKKNHPVGAWLKVSLLNGNRNSDKTIATVILPQAAQPVGERLQVSTKDLRNSAGKSDDSRRQTD